jgi:hypothetical protein
MTFVLLEDCFDDAAAWIWSDMLGLDRPATFAEAADAFERSSDDGNEADYYDYNTGAYLGPDAMAIGIRKEHVGRQ